MRVSLALLLLLVPCSLLAQLEGKPYIDSLLNDLSHEQSDSMRVKLLNRIAFAYKSIDPNEGIRFGQEQLRLSEELGLKKGIASAYNVLGLNYQYKSAYPKALEYFNKALLNFADNPKSLPYGSIISNIAVIQEALGNYDKALEYNFKSLEINLAMKDTFNVGGDYGNIGINYLEKKQFDKALEYDRMSLAIFTELNDKSGIAHNLGNIGNVYKELRNYTKALEYDQKALDIFEQLGDNGGMAINLGNMGGVYLAMAKALDTVRLPGDTIPPGTRQQFIARAIEYLTRAIDLSEQIGQSDNIIEFSRGLYEVQSMAGNYKAALDAYIQYTATKDSVYSLANKVQIENLETERQLAMKDKEIQIERLQVVQKRNERIIFIITTLLLLAIMAIVLRKWRAQKKRAKQLAIERKKHLDRIEQQKMVLGDISHRHAHDVRGQVATIIGLVEVFNTQDHTDPDNKTVIEGIGETAMKLDAIVKDMIISENKVNNK